jgi:kynurenine formamidase
MFIASIDAGSSKDFIAHRILLGAGVYGIENLNSEIDHLPPVGTTIMVMPLKLTGGSGSPARIICLVPE